MSESNPNIDKEMLELMKAREMREAAEYAARIKEADRLAAEQREKYRRMEEAWAEDARRKFRRWKNCNHLRGLTGPNYVAPLIKVSFLGLHIFPDNTVRIKCEKCGMKWYKTDTAEFIVRDGQKQENPTGLSFHDALQLYQEGDPNKTHASSALRFGTVVDSAQEQLKR